MRIRSPLNKNLKAKPKLNNPEKVTSHQEQVHESPTRKLNLQSKKKPTQFTLQQQILPSSQQSPGLIDHKKDLVFKNGDEYDGTLVDGIFEGQGVYRMKEEGLLYEGSFTNGLFHGYGIVRQLKSNGRIIYEGSWRNGRKDGNGTYYYSNGQIYQGQWKDNQKHGVGKYQSAAGSYNGHWENDQKSGQGILKLNKGPTLAGTWSNNNFMTGKITYSDGSSYSGEVDHRYDRVGVGDYEYRSGAKFRGNWQHNLKQGKGYYTYQNGEEFEGNFQNNQKHGRNCKYRWNSPHELRNATYIEDKLKSGTIYDKSKTTLQGKPFILS